MKTIKCDTCGKKIGRIENTGVYDCGFERVKLIKTHMTTTDEIVNPNAKIDKYKYAKITRCNYCGSIVNNW